MREQLEQLQLAEMRCDDDHLALNSSLADEKTFS
jgi:hypothetical protein